MAFLRTSGEPSRSLCEGGEGGEGGEGVRYTHV